MLPPFAPAAPFPALNRWLLFLVLLVASAGAVRADLALVEKWPSGDAVCSDAPLRLTFDQPPVLGPAGKIEVCRAADGVVVATVDPSAGPVVDRYGQIGGFQLRTEPVWIDGNTAQVRLPAHSLNPAEAYIVRIAAGVFQDGAGKAFSGLSEDWKFKTKAAMARNPDQITVAADGSADFCTVQGAVDQVEPHREKPVVITVRKGLYHEFVRIGRERRHVQLIGEDRAGSIIASANNEKLNSGWLQRAVLGVEGDDFLLENLTVENTTPYKGSQAEAVFVNADRAILRKADFRSFQDTLNLSGRVFVADCKIDGDVDYVWGYGTACFARCELHTLHNGYLVQSRNAPERGGYTFLDCRLTAASGVKNIWLARIETTRFPASEVSFIRCAMDASIAPAGWQVTGAASPALRFTEAGSTDLEGKPLDLAQRSTAARSLTPEQAAAITPASLLGGADGWKPE